MSMRFKIESGVQLLARLTKKPNIEKFHPILFQSGPTEALIQTKLNGVAAAVLIFNTDGNLNYDELINVVRRKISSTMTSADTSPQNTTLNKKVHETMANIHIVNIYDATQFYTTIYNLESTLVEHPNISLVIFDTLTAFFWSEQSFKITKMDFYTKNLINTIQKVTKEYKTICMYTRPENFCTNKDSENIPAEVNYQIQLLDNDNGNFQVNIKTLNTKTTKFFRVLDGDLKWI